MTILTLFYILEVLYEKVYIPIEVKEEIEKGLKEGVELNELSKFSFIKTCSCENKIYSPAAKYLGKGEKALISCALKTVIVQLLVHQLDRFRNFCIK